MRKSDDENGPVVCETPTVGLLESDLVADSEEEVIPADEYVATKEQSETDSFREAKETKENAKDGFHQTDNQCLRNDEVRFENAASDVSSAELIRAEDENIDEEYEVMQKEDVDAKPKERKITCVECDSDYVMCDAAQELSSF
ncbi:uncharacterized protein MONOS_17517 [Monocercomonoides exilis]|uniref:uncharacterized protein n=1 Tax=Monocercomonoides exilis TaxID=2049356 RepID=UPI00355A9550|nr:hypothetical protein MONOS_17517 [Monocercomonoides exilis]